MPGDAAAAFTIRPLTRGAVGCAEVRLTFLGCLLYAKRGAKFCVRIVSFCSYQLVFPLGGQEQNTGCARSHSCGVAAPGSGPSVPTLQKLEGPPSWFPHSSWGPNTVFSRAAGGGRGVNHRQAEWAEPGDGGWSSGLLDLGVWSCLAVWGADAER